MRWLLAAAGVRSARSEHGPCRGHIGPDVERVRQRAQQSRAARIVECHRAHQSVEHVDVVGERLGVGVDERQVGAPEAVERALAGGLQRSECGRRE